MRNQWKWRVAWPGKRGLCAASRAERRSPRGEAAHKYNGEHTVDPESRCLPGGLPREDAGDGGFQLLQVSNNTVFLYQYGTFRLVPTDGRKHTEDPDPAYFGEEIGS